MPLPKADQMSSWPDIVPLLTTRCLYWGCQGANRGVEVPYTMFQNPRSKPSCHKSTKTIITQKVLVTQSSNIVHCNWHTQKSISADFQAFLNTFSLFKLTFFNFLSGGVQQTAINFTFCWWFWLGKCIEIAWGCIYRVQGMPNPMALVLSLYDKQFLKIKISGEK